LNIEFFSSTRNDDKISFRIIMLIFISNNFHFWIKEFKDLVLKIKVWQYINSNDNMKKLKKKILFEIDHFSVKNSNSQSITDDLMTNQTIFAAISHSRSARWLHELTSNQQENYKANVKKYKRKKKLIVKISQKMLKINETIRVFVKSYILFEMTSIFIKKILQFLIIKYQLWRLSVSRTIHHIFIAKQQSHSRRRINKT
jgi:hypothetical protein